MNYRQYGKSGYEVSALGLGCMRLPRVFENGKAQVDKEKAFELIRYAATHGINYFDTAYGYHNQTSESVLGEALEGGLRQQVKIATKQPTFAMKTQADIRRNLENTLKKLRTDYIDIYLIHNINPANWEEIQRREIYKEYEKFRDEGMIKAIAFSYHGGAQLFPKVLAAYPWDMCQIQQNLLDTDKEATENAITLAGQKGCALVIMEPLRGGGLAQATATVQTLYDEFPIKRSPVEWAFRHLLNYPQVSAILSGMTTMEQLKENIAIFSKPDAIPDCLSGEEKALLCRVKAAYDAIKTIPCTGCEYCMPCPNGVNIPRVFELYNDALRFENFDPFKRGYWFTTSMGNDAGRCEECGECEQKCPQGIEIMNQLKVAHQALEGWIE
ncbi:MAG: aldo/keto reductase [Candidatus Azobacteroides sp.]|nr:aldo/keto reductase [Candidatus Azobacteroides sp.]